MDISWVCLVPFLLGHHNDASINKHVINNNEQNIKEWLHVNDIVIVGRGFRDTVHVMEELELQVKIRACLKGKKAILNRGGKSYT